MKYIVLLIALFSQPVLSDHHIRTTDLHDICTTKTSTIRSVSQRTKDYIKARDGYWSIYHGSGNFEIDHRINLWLGGSNHESNLMLQPYFGKCNAYDKDKLEIRLHYMVCGKKLSVQQAQTEIYDNWIAAYSRYVDPKGCNK